MSFPKITYPSTPTLPAAPTLSQIVAGALAGRTYYVRLTCQTQFAETPWGAESLLAIDAGKLLKVSSPAGSGGGAFATGYNVYAGTTSGTETKQNTTPILIGTDWTEPNTGLIAGAAPPTTWASTTLTFRYPPRFKPSYAKSAVRHDNVASSGVKEVVYERTDNFIEFDMEWILAADRAGWQAFLDFALEGGAFDYYPDASLSAFDAYVFENMDAKLAWKAPSVDTLTGVKMRKRVPWP